MLLVRQTNPCHGRGGSPQPRACPPAARDGGPAARDASTSWLVRRSTMIRWTLASGNPSTASKPVGPAPAIATAWSVIVTLSASTVRHPSTCPFVPRVDLALGDSAARPGCCRKPPGARYIESGRERAPPLVFLSMHLVRMQGSAPPRRAFETPRRRRTQPDAASSAWAVTAANSIPRRSSNCQSHLV